MSLDSKKQDVKKEPSALQKGGIRKEEFMRSFKDSSLFSETNMGEAERTSLGKRLFGSSYGSYINEKEIRDVEKQIELGKWGKFKDFNLTERNKAKKLIEGVKKRILGK